MVIICVKIRTSKRKESTLLMEGAEMEEADKMTNRQLAAMETKEKLLRAGKQLIGQKGLCNTAIEEITEEAGVSKGTFYTYFKRKEDIIFELSKSMFGEILDQAKAFEGNFIGKLTFYMVHFSRYIEQGSVRLSQEWVRNAVNPDLVDSQYDKGKLRQDLASVHELILFGAEKGLLKEDVPAKELSEILVDMLYGQMLCWSMSGGSYSLKERTQEFCSRYLNELLKEYIKESRRT